MDYSVSAYFEASRHLAERISEAKRIECRRNPCYRMQLANSQIANAANKVSEFIEIFTWETRNTDLIRIAFIEIAKDIHLRLIHIQEDGRWPDHFNGTDNFRQLQEDIAGAFEKALYSNGRHTPYVEIRESDKAWDCSMMEKYLSDMQRQLQHASFDNLLEAVTYYERSNLLLKFIFN